MKLEALRRRSATQFVCGDRNRGLKSTANFITPLRGDKVRITFRKSGDDCVAERHHDGSRGLEPTDRMSKQDLRRGATLDGAQLGNKKGRTVANTYTCLYYHLIFSTKNREKWITPEIEQRLWAYLGGIASQNNLRPLLIGGVDDHVHMLVGMPPSITVSEALRQIKGGSSAWVKETFPECRGFGWQDGYGAFTVSKSQIPEVEDYIRKQREHHRVRTFMEEYRAFLERHEIKYDERYLWD